MPAVDTPVTPTRPTDLPPGPAEQDLYAGILASLGALVGRYATAPHDTVVGFKMAYALLDGLPPQVVIGVAAEAMRSLYGSGSEPPGHGAR